MVFTHGAGMDHSMFDSQVLDLHGAGYRVVTWDLRGHGASTLAGDVRFEAAAALADLAALLDHLALDRPVLVGHSLGGNLSQEFVRRHPRAVRGLVVLDSTWNTGPLTLVERLLLPLAAPVLALVPASGLPARLARASAVTPAGVAACEAAFTAMPKRRFLDVWRATTTLVAPDPDYRTPVPLALVRGEHDRTGNIAAAMPRWARSDGVREYVVADAGHVVTVDAPERTARLLRDIIAGWETDERNEAGTA